MKLSKFLGLVLFHFAINLLTLGKINADSYTRCNECAVPVSEQSLLSDSLCTGTLSPNLLRIGDFGSGEANIITNDPFITVGYDYQDAPPPDDGFYTITNDISDWGSFADLFWINIQDNSLDTNGYFMVINANFDPGNFYKENISVCENTTYIFSADMINLTKPEIPNFIFPSVDFIINEEVISSVNDISQDATWHTTQFSYTTGPGETTLTYLIRNSAPGGFGNDLALDNIFMKTCKADVAIEAHGNLCEDAYLEATPSNVPENYTPHYQWEYSIDQGANWVFINETNSILPLNNQPTNAIFRALVASGQNSFGLEHCHGTSNEIDLLFPAIVTQTNPIICDDESHMVAGNAYTSNGVYRDTFSSFFGCDSIVITDLSVLETTELQEEVIICEGETYDFLGTTVFVADQYKDTLINFVGCDSVVILDLVVLENAAHNFETNICESDSYFFNDQELSTTGIYLDTLVAQNGCDSFLTLQLNVNLAFESFEAETICFGETFNFNGIERTESGDYDYAIQATNGCDSTFYLSLTVLEEKSNVIDEAFCGGEDFSFNNITYTTSGVFQDVLITADGCDSLVTLNLVFEDVIESAVAEEICEDEEFFFNNVLLTNSGIYKDTLISESGCDSIVTIDFVVLEKAFHDFEIDICSSETYLYNDQELSATGIYLDTLIAQNGCDSLLTLQLIVNPAFESFEEETICFGETFTFNGVEQSESGEYDMILPTTNGCDSVFHLSLTVLEEKSNVINEVFCDGQEYVFNNITYTTTGVFEDIFTTNEGCDSTVTLNLTFSENSDLFIQQSICEDEGYEFGNQMLFNSGMYSDTLMNQYGCDSIVYLELMVNPIFETDLPVNICNGEIYLFNGVDYSTSGTYPVAFNSNNNCDSIINVQLFVADLITTNLQEEICEGESIEVGGNDFSSTGDFEVVLSSYTGCDSIVTLDLIVHENKTMSLQEIICSGETFEIGGNNYFTTGIHSVNLVSHQGCDSLVTLDLTVYQSESFEELTFCNGENYNGMNRDTLLTIVESSYLGCDSIVQLQLYFHQINQVMVSGDLEFCEGETRMLSVNEFDTYLWSNGETNSITEIDQPGIYEVTVWDANGCSNSTSVEVEMRTLDAEISFQNPNCNNANSGFIQIEDVFGSGGSYQYSIDGETFSTQKTYFNLAAGNYQVTVRDEEGCDYMEELTLKSSADISIELGENKMITYGESIDLLTDFNIDGRIESFSWFPETGLSCIDCPSPVANPLEATMYTLTVTTTEGCTIQDQILINVFKPKDVFVPNIFSPNGDGENEVFKVYAGVMVERILEFQVFDRWGEHVYSELPDGIEMNGWDGTFRNGNLKQDVYIYYARILFVDGDEKIVKGDVTLLR